MLRDVRVGTQSQSFLLQVLDTLPAAAYTCDTEGLITYCNRNAVEVWGRAPRLNDSADRYCGSYKLFYADGTPMRHDECWMARTLQERISHNGQEVLIQQPDGGLRSALAHANPLLDEQDRFIGASNVLVNITDRKRFEEQLAHQATHDALTGLPNRVLMLKQMDRAIAEADSKGTPFALLLLDLDRFKTINDTFGHEYGDEVLREMRPRLLGVVREGDLVARLGGDEFAILLPGADRSRAVGIAERVIAALVRPIVIAGRSFDVGTSIGIALHPEHGRDAATMLRHADVAMYAAKRAQSGSVLYADDQQATTPQLLSMAAELRRAIEDEGLTLHYQPKVDLATLEIVGVEALVRWSHPRRGVLPPGDFLSLVEANSLSRRLDSWAFREALRQCREWHQAGLGLELAVNLFPDSLLDEGFLDAALGLIDQEAGPPIGLTVELSERALVSDPERTRTALDRLRSRGIRVALDDFGTGYSSLAHLKLLQVDEVKLDVSFVRGLPGSRTDASIAETVIDLGSRLGLMVTAEGVECREAMDWLAARGCDRAQGFFFARPMPPAKLLTWLATPSRALSISGPPSPTVAAAQGGSTSSAETMVAGR